MDLAAILSYLFPGVTFGINGQCLIVTDSSGTNIVRWSRPEPQPTPAEIAAAILPAAKAARIEQDRQECRRRLFEHYGDAAEQLSRAMGIGYTAQATTNHAIGVAACRDASNAARDQINAATTIEQVEAVTVQWPVLT